MPTPQWRQWLNEQTPPCVKIDRDGTRALGYKRFKLGRLVEFARKSKGLVTLEAPYVTISPFQAEDHEDDVEEDAEPWPEHTKNKPTLQRKVLLKLQKEVGDIKTKRCVAVMNLLELPPQKVGVRCVTSLGQRHPVALVFRINDCPIKHEVLKNINECPWVKACYVSLIETIIHLKVVIS